MKNSLLCSSNSLSPLKETDYDNKALRPISINKKEISYDNRELIVSPK